MILWEGGKSVLSWFPSFMCFRVCLLDFGRLKVMVYLDSFRRELRLCVLSLRFFIVSYANVIPYI
jgi:hypothetical protein